MFSRLVGAALLLLFLPFRSSAQNSVSQPVTLDQAIHEALEKNLGLLAERYNLSVADARIVQARLHPNPVLSLGLDYQDLFREHFSLAGGQGPPEWNARVDFLLERGGKRQARIDVAQNAKEVSKLQLLNTTRGLVLDVENAFLDAQSARELLELTRSNFKSLSEIARINAERVRAGDLAKVDEIRSRVASLQSRNAVAAAELKLRTAKTKLQLLLGRTGNADAFDVAGDMRREDAPMEATEIHTVAMARRPDLSALRQDQARSLAEIRSQLAQGKTDFTVGTIYHRQFGIISADAMGFYVSAPLPVFNRNQGEIERARQESRQIETRIRALEASIENEISAAFQQYASAGSLVRDIETNMLGEAREVSRIMEYSYKRGEATLLEYLDAQRALNDTMQTYNDARTDFARSLYLLDSVSGRGVNP